MLTVLLAAAVALTPVGAASAGMPAPGAPGAKTPAEQSHAMHRGHDHGTMQMAATAERNGADHCDRKAADRNCCDDEGSCAQTCLQKCFGQVAVLPPDRTARTNLQYVVAPRPAERPPGWSSAPQLPPPRA